MRRSRSSLLAVLGAAFALTLLPSCGDDTGSSPNEAARDVLDAEGVDPSSELLYEHFFYFDDETSARAAQSDLVDAGFDVDISSPGEGVDWWSLVATQEASLDLDQLDALTTEMQALATRHGGTYDGWGTALK